MSRPYAWSGLRRPIHTTHPNGIRRTTRFNCAATPAIMIETFIPSEVKLITTLLDPLQSWKQEIELFTGHSWIKNIKAYIDARETEPVEATAWDGALRHLFRLAALGDTAGYFLFLGQAFSDFLTDWTSMARRAEGCEQHPSGNWFDGSQPYGNQTWNTGWSLGPAWYGTFEGQPNTHFGDEFQIPAGQSGEIGGSLTLLNGLPDGGQMQTRIVDEGGTVYSTGAGIQRGATNTSPSLVIATGLQGGHTYQFQWRIDVPGHDFGYSAAAEGYLYGTIYQQNR